MNERDPYAPQAVDDSDSVQTTSGTGERILAPAAIEARSMQIIDEELRELGVSASREELVILRRVIHATADFDYAQNLWFVGDAARAGSVALVAGATVVCDTNMARAGIAKATLARFGSEARCFVADDDVTEASRATGTTRAVAAMRKAMREAPGAIVAVGNAPTALFELCDLMRTGARPALVIAVPVGFVNVVEAKEEALACCEELGVPAIVARGRKGGSTVATAIVNALAYEAAGLTDPRIRMAPVRELPQSPGSSCHPHPNSNASRYDTIGIESIAPSK